ncbi:MAG: dihydroxy-acid dehydratase [Flavobacteriales bacterium Tduv]
MKKAINRFSSKLTEDPGLPASQAMLHATGLTESDLHKAQIGIVSNWYEGNPCNMHLNTLGENIKASIQYNGLIGFQFNTIGISDGITMSTLGMRYSLPSRELIADSIESMAAAHHHDGVVAIPGCDKNMPGALMALLRLNRPSIIVYGGSIASGCYNGEKLNIISAFEALGERNAGKISEETYKEIIKKSCPGAGACGGMYTANTMAIALEAMGMTLPYSSSLPAAVSDAKKQECWKVGKTIKNLLKKNITPKDIVTKKALQNAITLAIALGGSTNLVLHLLAIAKTAEVELKLADFQEINQRVPFIGNLKPSGEFLMEDIHTIGGTPVIMRYLLNEGLLQGDCITVTGKTLAENLEKVPDLSFDQKIIYPLHDPIKKDGHLQILYGNLAPDGSVAKITSKEGLNFSGLAKTFDSEKEANEAISGNKVQAGDVIVIRYVGPRGAPGMPEMLKPTSYIMGVGLGKSVALITDGRFSGGSHGFVVGHITPEAQIGGPIALVKNGDLIIIDSENNTITLEISDTEMQKRREQWIAPTLKEKAGYLYKYAKTVSSASEGCVTDQFLEL